MGTKLFVGSIHLGIMEDELREYFEVHGTVNSCELVIDKLTGRSRGFAFIDMGSESEAKKAIRAMDGKSLEDKNISVKEARPRENRGGRGNNRR